MSTVDTAQNEEAMPLPNIVRRVRMYKLLRTGVAFSLDELAAILHVRRQTIRRDLTTLEQSDARLGTVESNGVRVVRLGSGILEPRGIRC